MKHLVKKSLEGLFFSLTLWLSDWLKKNSVEKWRKIVVLRGDSLDAKVAGHVVSAAPRAFKTNELKTLYGGGCAADSTSQLNRAPSQLIWAREIETFLLNQLSIHTKKAYENDLKQFFLFLSEKINLENIQNIQPEHIILFRKAMEEGRLTGLPMQKSTINRKLAVVKSFLNWLRANRFLSDNPAQFVKGFPQSQESSLMGLSDSEAFEMLQKPSRNTRSGSLHSAILTTLLYTGLRKGELIGLKIGDLVEERGVKVLKVRGKGHRIRIIPITNKVKEALDAYLTVNQRNIENTTEPLFIPTKNPRFNLLDKALNPNAISYIVQRYAKKSGVLKRISPHSCRATCISNALDKKASHRSVQYLAGWSTPLMIQRYDKRREDIKNSAAYSIDYFEAQTA